MHIVIDLIIKKVNVSKMRISVIYRARRKDVEPII